MKCNESTCATCVLEFNRLRKKFYIFIILIMPSRVELPAYFIADIELDNWTDSDIDDIMDGAAADGDSQDTSKNIRIMLMFTIKKTKL